MTIVVITTIVERVPKLGQEIQSTKPFALLEEEAALNIIRTAEVFQQQTSRFLKSYDLTASQYNVLRILRGSETTGLTCGQCAERMINHDPDVTRLFNRLEARGWVRRERSPCDKRVVRARITAAGLALLAKIDPEIVRHLRRRFKDFGEQRLRQLIELMEQAREPSTEEM